MTIEHSDALKAKISDHTAVIGIIGMGYVGLPLALTFFEKGFRVLGFDVDPVEDRRASTRRELHQASRRRNG